MRKLLALATLVLAGCSTVAPLTIDEELLVRCKTFPPLQGLTGGDILRWAEAAGPDIVECARIHNALVTVIKSQQ